MGVIQDSEYVLYKSMVQHIKKNLQKVFDKLSSKCYDEFLKFEKKNNLFLNCETYEDLGDSSKKIKVQRKKLLELLAIQDRIEKILKRNEQRLEFIDSRLRQVGIYNDAVDKKVFAGEIAKEQKNVNGITLNLNPKQFNDITYKYFAGEIVAFKNDVLDFSLEENSKILMEGSADFFHEVIFTFPYSVESIPDEIYMMAGVKNKIIKECVLYVASKLKTQSIYESNKELGCLLENARNILNIAQYAKELRNYFNVVVKQCIKIQTPELSEGADEYLKCDETSEFLPANRRLFEEDIESGEKTEVSETIEASNDLAEDFADKETKQADFVQNEDSQSNKESDEEVDDELDNVLSELETLLLDEDDESDEQSEVDETANESENFVQEEDSQSDKESGENVNNELDKALSELESLLLEDDDDDDEEEKNG